MYHPPKFPSKCNYCKTPRSRPCSTQLFAVKNVVHHGLSGFSLYPALKVQLKIEVLNSPENVTVDIQKGLAWQNLSGNHNGEASNQVDLVFSLLIKWFNPRGNKLAQKQHKLQYTLISSLTLGHWLQE
ncbi:uncharacterized protein VP01_3474g2 [Puccinia sorghi]|uniref:Uncharacterized protein n=1 Tax=Puccinia sorghi TaxID=27349 RepID=A0A0L6UVZ9_9BASI|nr:uncharacterized protein VP01_3474g2 [Puccinia sorghi]